MTAIPHRVKGWCPGALRPMATGDGLLVRLRIAGGIVPAALLARIADLAARLGNGLVDQSQRANLQIRGVGEAEWPVLIEALAGLGLVDEDADAEAIRNVIASPLAGLDPTAPLDGGAVAAELERLLGEDPALRALPGKFGFLVDEGGALPLDDTGTDIRIVGLPDGRAMLALGGTVAEAQVAALVGLVPAQGDSRSLPPAIPDKAPQGLQIRDPLAAQPAETDRSSTKDLAGCTASGSRISASLHPGLREGEAGISDTLRSGSPGDDAAVRSAVARTAAEAAVALARAYLALRRPEERRMKALVARVGAAEIAAAAGLVPNSAPPPAAILDKALHGPEIRDPIAGQPSDPEKLVRHDPASLAASGSRIFASLRPGLRRRGAGDRLRPGLRSLGDVPCLAVAAPFGRWEAGQLAALATIAERFGSGEVRLTPWRMILVPGVTDAAAVEAARAAGLIVAAEDPRLAVVSCAGRPGCESGLMPARQDGALLAAAAAALPGSGVRLHVSGCPKGCARPEAAAVTLVGRETGYDLVIAGGVGDEPAARGLQAKDALARIAALAQKQPMTTTVSPPAGPATRESYIRDGQAIYDRSFAIIRAEADLARFTVEEEPVAVRIIHGCGMVEVAADILFAPGAVVAAKAALRAGAPILCDAKMVANGVTRSRLPAGNDVVCTLDDPRVPDLARRIDNTRTAAAMELWRERLPGSVVAIGNAPTALFRLLELLDEGVAPPAAVIGMPVGFVGAAESKEALMADGRVPWLVVRGRKGGSAMTAATVNALASDRE